MTFDGQIVSIYMYYVEGRLILSLFIICKLST